jgi:hypothetical protein
MAGRTRVSRRISETSRRGFPIDEPTVDRAAHPPADRAKRASAASIGTLLLAERDRQPQHQTRPAADERSVANSIVRSKVGERSKAIVDGCALSAQGGSLGDWAERRVQA